MIAASGVLTSRGGKTSHAAVVARGMGRTCVCGAEAIDVDVATRTARGRRRRGQRGRRDRHRRVDRGGVPRRRAGRDLTGRPTTWRRAWTRVVADGPTRRPPTWCARSTGSSPTPTRPGGCGCGPTPTPPTTPPAPGGWARRASGCAAPSTCSSATAGCWSSGWCWPTTPRTRDAALEALEPLQRDDFVALFEAMDGLPVTVRLLDPPLHEFLPDRTELAVKVAVAHERGEDTADGREAAGRGRAAARVRTRCSGCAACGWG